MLPDTLSAAEARLKAALPLGALELAGILGCSEAHVWRMHSAAKLPAPVRIGRLTKSRVQEVNAWVVVGCPVRSRWTWTAPKEGGCRCAHG